MKLTTRLIEAMQDCESNQPFFWKRKSMEKLAAAGLAEAFKVEGGAFSGQVAYRLTDAGRAALAIEVG